MTPGAEEETEKINLLFLKTRKKPPRRERPEKRRMTLHRRL